MDLGIKGKVALVAASSQGLGRAVAEELAAEGVSLIVCARREGEIADMAQAIESRSGVPALAVAADLTQADDIQRLVDLGIQKFGRIDILVTNTGGPPAGQFENFDREAWQRATDLLLMSAVDLIRLVLPQMKTNRWGRILNITSISVKQPVDNLILSNSLRAAVTGMARTLANEVAEYGITVNNILPGYTATERVEQLARSAAERQNITVDEARSTWENQIPMRRLGRPEEFAALAAFLVSERAGYITGTSIPVDGGWTRSLL
jgi:3-oxoacyl-[acyl-carrier protein] reductase